AVHRGVSVALFVTALVSATPDAAQPQTQHVTTLWMFATCPPTAEAGTTVTCTVSVENQDPDHGANITITSQLPFPGGEVGAVTGCNTFLGPNAGLEGAGTDFTTCLVQEILPPCTGDGLILVLDQFTANGEDADALPMGRGGFGGVPVSSSAVAG